MKESTQTVPKENYLSDNRLEYCFAVQQNLTAHQKIHDKGEFFCEECNKTYTTELGLKQHVQGKHGNGTLMLCGKSYQQQTQKYRHQKDCDECLKIKAEQEKNLPLQTLSLDHGNTRNHQCCSF